MHKKTDPVSFKDKDTVWCIIEPQFNESSGVYHGDAKVLKCNDENLKKESKRRFSEDRKYVYGTGFTNMFLISSDESHIA